ncbi:MAG TPA: VOC family protein [Acidimicrobiales bacterium]|nr:VOC family protein [Acidimicrobiales bacterium]
MEGVAGHPHDVCVGGHAEIVARVADVAELDRQHDRVMALGGRLVHDRSDDPQEPLRVYADPAGHPFCVFVAG